MRQEFYLVGMKCIYKRGLPIKERFMNKVKVGRNCWNWQAYKTNEGYGVFRVKTTTQLAHRIAYKLFVGNIPKDMMVCHHCDNPSCVNPNHLFIGKNQDNTNDKVQKRRDRIGVELFKAKLNEKLVIKIRKEYYSKTTTHRMLAKKYKISPSRISDILNNKAWRHI